MRLLALDQSSKITGYAVFEDKELIDYGHFTCAQTDLGERLLNIRKNVHQLIDKYNITQVIMEDIQLQDNKGNNVQTFKILAEVFGVIYELLIELNIPVEAVLASVWKSKIGITSLQRPEQKLEAQSLVKSLYKKQATEDESDAICIGHSYLNKEKAKKSNEIFDWSN